jgi:hypothetical protein
MITRINYMASPRAADSTFDFPDRGDPLEVHYTALAPKALMKNAAEINIPVDTLENIGRGELHAYIWMGGLQ